MQKLISLALALFLSACASGPKLPMPDESNRQAVNRTIPVELLEVPQ